MDTVVGEKGGTKEVLLVVSERCSRKELIYKIKNKSQHEVIKVLNRLERKHGMHIPIALGKEVQT